MRTIVVLAVLAVTLALATTLLAEKPDTPPAALRKHASHIVVGKVNAIYSRVRMHGKMRVTNYIAEVKVKAVEKGEGIGEGSLQYVRYWSQEWTGGFEDMPVGTSGHRGLPGEGETVRIYLARNSNDGFGSKVEDGGLNVLGANGFEKVEADGGR